MASGQGRGSMSLSMKLIRLLIVLFNLVFVVIGSVLLAIGIYLIKDPKINQLRPLLNPDVTSKYSSSLSGIEIFAIALIVIGSILLLIGFLGTKNKQKKILYLFNNLIYFRLLWSNKRFSIFTCSLCNNYWWNNPC
jgi:membrane protease YdiL (CAAX protease family)